MELVVFALLAVFARGSLASAVFSGPESSTKISSCVSGLYCTDNGRFSTTTKRSETARSSYKQSLGTIVSYGSTHDTTAVTSAGIPGYYSSTATSTLVYRSVRTSPLCSEQQDSYSTGSICSHSTSKRTSLSASRNTTLSAAPYPATTVSATKTATHSVSSTTALEYASAVPDIDVCGTGSGNVSCPGAGSNGYYYRCCSGAGHCGPKNPLQAQSLYCGGGCQPGYGQCNDTMSPPPYSTKTPAIAQDGDTCGPIVNKKCAQGLCCSGSNYCGTGADFCGSANWCQARFGRCDDS